MASNRHLGRIVVLQSLYEHEFRFKAGDASAEMDSIIAKNIEPYAKALGDTEFVYDLAHAVVAASKKLDETLQPLAPEWPINSLSSIDRNILRMGLFELESKQVPPKVAINEAVELAKSFGSDNSSKFINGVLGTAFRNLDPAASKPQSSEGNHETVKTSPKASAKNSQTVEKTSNDSSQAK